MLLGTLGASLSGNLLTGKGAKALIPIRGLTKRSTGTIRAGFLMSPHILANFETQEFYQNVPELKDVYLRSNLPKIKDAADVINLDEHKSIGTL